MQTVQTREGSRTSHHGILLYLPASPSFDDVVAAPPQSAPSHSFTKRQLRDAAHVVDQDLWHELDVRGVGFFKRRRVPKTDIRLVEIMIEVAGVTRPGQIVKLDRVQMNDLNTIIHSRLPQALILVGMKQDAPIIYDHAEWWCTPMEQEDNVRLFIHALGCSLLY